MFFLLNEKKRNKKEDDSAPRCGRGESLLLIKRREHSRRQGRLWQSRVYRTLSHVRRGDGERGTASGRATKTSRVDREEPSGKGSPVPRLESWGQGREWGMPATPCSRW